MKLVKYLLLMVFVVGLNGVILAEDIPVPVTAAVPAAPPPKKWKNVTDLSLVATNGNTKTSSTSGKNAFTYDWSRTKLEFNVGGLGSKSNGVRTAEQYYANQKVLFKLTDRNYMFEKGGWEKNKFAGFNNRYDENVGLGRELIKKPKDLLIGELGGGYINEERVNAKVNDFVSGRAYTKYTRTVSETASFTQDAEYLHNFEDKDDFRVNTETALTAAISTHFSMKVSYTWKHVGSPPVGFGRNDTTTAVALVANY